MDEPARTEDALSSWLRQTAHAHAQLIVSQLVARRGSAFQLCGEAAVGETVSALLATLQAEIAGGEHVRRDLSDCLRPLSSRQLGFRDLRGLLLTLRSTLLSAVEQMPTLPTGSLRRIDDWCLEMSLQIGLLLLAMREEVIARQAGEIEARLAEQRQLSIPIAPVHEGVLMIPLVGAMDSYRAEVLTERVLKELERTRAQILLLDISGVTAIDKEIASYLWKVTQATRLLGAEMVWVGISAETAKIFVNLGIDLHNLVTLRSMQDGLAYALARLQRRIVSTEKG